MRATWVSAYTRKREVFHVREAGVIRRVWIRARG